MQVATILPQEYLHLTEDDTYLMALAHLIERPGMEKYTDFFKQKALEEDTFIIMDNGVIENDPRPIEELLDKALRLNVSELILPDVFRNSIDTLKLVDEATNYIVKQADKTSQLGFMAVPQGETLDQWISCATYLLDNPIITSLGIPKVLVDIAGRDGRYRAILELIDRVGDFYGRELHLLGCWTTPLELTILAKAAESGELPEIRGVDSALPYVFARAGLKLNESDRPDNNPIDFESGKIEAENTLQYNVMFWRDCVDLRKNKKIIFI